MREFDILKGVIAGFTARPEHGVLVGPGDDCAVCSLPSRSLPGCSLPGQDRQEQSLLLTVDTMAENVHFRHEWSSPEDLAWKLVASNVSDVLAMAGRPWVGLLSCQYGRNLPDDFIDRFYAGLRQVSDNFQLSVVGGDTLCGSESSFSLSLLGMTSKPVYRSTAIPGDDIWVTGEIGYSWLGLQSLLDERNNMANSTSELLPKSFSSEEVAVVLSKARTFHLRPELPQEFIIAMSGKDLINSMIDISDGLLQDAGHIARMSHCCMVMETGDIPRVPVAEEHLIASLSGGEDYQLLFTALPGARNRIEEIAELTGIKLSRIGTVRPLAESGGEVELRHHNILLPIGDNCGYQHQW